MSCTAADESMYREFFYRSWRGFIHNKKWSKLYSTVPDVPIAPIDKPPLLDIPRGVSVVLISVIGGAFVGGLLQKAEERDVVAKTAFERMNSPPERLPAQITPESYKELAWRPFFVSGELLHDMELRVTAQRHKNQLGVHIITPLKRSDTGTTILVNRGWVPPELIKPSTRHEAQVPGLVTILGNLVPGDTPAGPSVGGNPVLTLKNQIDKNIWFWRDLPTMAELTGAEPILLDVQADPPNPGGYPIGGQTLFPLTNNYRRDAAIAGGITTAIALGIILAPRMFPKVFSKAASEKIPKVWAPKPPPSMPFK